MIKKRRVLYFVFYGILFVYFKKIVKYNFANFVNVLLFWLVYFF